MNVCVIKEQVQWGTVDIVQAHMQKVIEVNILILIISIAVRGYIKNVMTRLTLL